MYIYSQYYQKEIFSTKIDDFEQSKQENNHYFAEIIIDKPYEDYWTAKIEWFD